MHILRGSGPPQPPGNRRPCSGNTQFEMRDILKGNNITILNIKKQKHCPPPRPCACRQHSSFEETLQQWKTVGNKASNLTDPRFEPKTSHFRDERVTAQPAVIIQT